ncbi:DUF3667 domain-containing protein [Flavobacterium sp.]|uniref:DUF3667 domain-containing protein n=1 Tax=Flavobacterium sp. TaxID=239 RepID=UPI0025C29BA1|nr:DUF3667 domain-containing protein [Flavobacterium sp.]
MTKATDCLNCSEPVEKKFCPNCGQKTDTHRITIKHFIAHDLLHGVWHVEKGLFFTLKEAIVRPGKAALWYIEGKRIKYYNVFYLALLLLALNAILMHWSHDAAGVIQTKEKYGINELIASYSKFFLFSIVPLLALNALSVFRRWKLNLAEHFIVAGMALLGILLMTACYFVFNILSEVTDWNIFGFLTMVCFFSVPLVPIWTYSNAFWSKYTIGGLIWRILVFYLLIFIEMTIILGAIVLLLSRNGQDANFVI